MSIEFPAFVQSLPEADIPIAGLRGWLLQSDRGLMVFHASDVELVVAEHSHCSQWGVVIEGQIDFTIAGQTRTCIHGDTYVLPDRIPHAGHIYAGFRSVDYFADPDHYRVRSQ